MAMYSVERDRSEIVITGTDGFEKTLPANAVVILKDPDHEQDRCAKVSDLQDHELVAYVLSLKTYCGDRGRY